MRKCQTCKYNKPKATRQCSLDNQFKNYSGICILKKYKFWESKYEGKEVYLQEMQLGDYGILGSEFILKTQDNVVSMETGKVVVSSEKATLINGEIDVRSLD